MFSTKVQTASDLSELRLQMAATPMYKVKLTYDMLRDTTVHDELRSLGGFFMARAGKFDSWLFSDPTDGAVTQQSLGLGNGTEANFSLSRTFGTFTERVANIHAVTQVRVANTPTSNYTLSSSGVVTFNTPPANAEPVDWTGTYYFRCRFLQDEQEFENFMYQLWAAQSVEFLANLGTKL
jgi:hypothetical protein